jgi:hypothetical protein
MTELVLLPLAFVVIVTVLGVATIAPLRYGFRQVLLPATPLIGAAMMAVVLSGTSWFLSAGWGMVVVVLAAAASVGVAVRLRRRFWRTTWRTAAVTLACWLVGALGAALAMIPNAEVGDSRIVMANANHDALFYTSVAGWLADHPILPIPVIGTSPAQDLAVPAFGAAAFAITYPLRIGQSMVHAALTRAVGSEVMTTAMPVLALWVFVVPGAVFVALRILRTRPTIALGGAIAVTFSALLIYQVVNQNMDSLFGVSLAVMTIGSVVGAAQGRMSRWPAAILLAALVAVYTEYALFVAPAVLGGVFIYRSRRYLRNLVRAVQVLALALVIAPTAWYRGAIQLSNFAGSGGDGWPSPFITPGSWVWLNRVLGAGPLADDSPLAKSAALFGVMVAIGCILAVVFSRSRGVWIGLLLVGVPYIVQLTLQQKGYTQFRSVVLFFPLLVVAAAAGWDGFVAFLRRHRWRVPATVTSGALVLLLIGWSFVNIRTVRAQVDPTFAAGRHLGDEYEQTQQWVAEFGGPEGQDITVLAPDFVENIGLNLTLRDYDELTYPMENANYLYVNEFWDGNEDPYVLVGTGTQTRVEPSAIVRRNDKFTLIDRRVAGGMVIAPMDLTGWQWMAQPDGSFLGSYGSELIVMQTDPAPGTPAVELAAGDPGASVPVELESPGVTDGTGAVLESTAQAVEVPNPGRATFLVTIDRPAAVPPQDRPTIRLSDLMIVGNEQ